MFKIRVFVKELSKMFLPEDVVYIDYSEKTVTVRGCQYPDCDTCHGDYDWEECEIMRFTGLKDKNGVEIFEGDVVCVLNSFYTVFYDEKRGSYRLKPHDERWHTDYMSNYAHDDSFEVIGNIYENPELLEVTDDQ